MASFQETFAKTLAQSTGAKLGKVSKDVPPPLELYNQAAPRVENMLRQYDAASPGIDFATKYWWLIAIAGFGIGVAASYAGQLLYSRVHRPRTNPRRRR